MPTGRLTVLIGWMCCLPLVPLTVSSSVWTACASTFFLLLLNPVGVDGVRAFGAILDPRAGYQALPIYSKNWIAEDPAAEYIMSQSAPLMIPGRPNASLKATVVA